MQLVAPLARSDYEGVGFRGVGRQQVVVAHVRVGIGSIAAIDQVQNELGVLPGVQELGEEHVLGQTARAAVDAPGRSGVDPPDQRGREHREVMI